MNEIEKLDGLEKRMIDLSKSALSFTRRELNFAEDALFKLLKDSRREMAERVRAALKGFGCDEPFLWTVGVWRRRLDVLNGAAGAKASFKIETAEDGTVSARLIEARFDDKPKKLPLKDHKYKNWFLAKNWKTFKTLCSDEGTGVIADAWKQSDAELERNGAMVDLCRAVLKTSEIMKDPASRLDELRGLVRTDGTAEPADESDEMLY